MKAIKIDNTGGVLIDTKKGFNVWMDVCKDGDELTADWNQYIFHLDNEDDVKIKTFQEDCNNFIEASEEAIDFYERHINLKDHGKG
jgi:hypothetical protein